MTKVFNFFNVEKGLTRPSSPTQKIKRCRDKTNFDEMWWWMPVS